MFTGLIREVGRLIRGVEENGGRRLTIEAPLLSHEELRIGESVSVNGICLTLVRRLDNGFEVQAVRETERRTTLERWRPGEPLNLERALVVGDRLDGHWITGHIDAPATITAVRMDRGARRLELLAPPGLSPLLPEKGSVALDGISLTIAESRGERLAVALIPLTWEQTTMRYRRAGDWVNLEVDILARYAARLWQTVRPEHQRRGLAGPGLD